MSKKLQDATKAWLEGLKKTGAISDEQWQVLEEATSKDEFVNYVGDTAMMRSDYSRDKNALQSEFQAKTDELQEYQKQLANWRGMTEKEVSQIKNEANQLRAERQRLVAVAQSYGLTESDLGDPVAPFTTNPTLNPEPKNESKSTTADSIDPTKFLSRAEAEELGTMYTLLPAEINDIVAEHVELFGKQPKGMRQIVERAIKEKRALREVYEDEFEVVAKRQERDEAQKEAEIKRRVDEQLTAYRTEHPEIRIPSPGRGSEILREKLTPPDENQNQASDQISSVRAAVNYWNQMDHSTD